jgi:hypothetical protein
MMAEITTTYALSAIDTIVITKDNELLDELKSL